MPNVVESSMTIRRIYWSGVFFTVRYGKEWSGTVRSGQLPSGTVRSGQKVFLERLNYIISTNPKFSYWLLTLSNHFWRYLTGPDHFWRELTTGPDGTWRQIAMNINTFDRNIVSGIQWCRWMTHLLQDSLMNWISEGTIMDINGVSINYHGTCTVHVWYLPLIFQELQHRSIRCCCANCMKLHNINILMFEWLWACCSWLLENGRRTAARE